MPPRPKRKAKRRFSDGDRSAKKQRFDEEDEDENDGSFMAFVSTETSSEDLLTEEEHDEAPLPRVISLLPDLPKPWKGHFKASYLEHSAPPFVRLHNEILEFCSFITPTKEEIAVRNALLAEITSLVTSLWPESRVQVFGSQLTQLLTPTSDMDLAVLGVTIPEHEDMNHILTVLACQIKSRMKVSYVEAITSAKVPIVKFDHIPSGISVDMCINNDSGIRTGEIMIAYMNEFPALRPLLCVLKVYLAQRKLGETYTGGIGSFVLAAMIVSFLQMRRRTAQCTGITHAPFNQNLGSLLMGFLQLYGCTFNYYTTGISLLDGGEYFNKAKHPLVTNGQQHGQQGRPGMLTISNPDLPEQDMGKNSFLLPKVRRAFDHCQQLLCAAMRIPQRDSYLAFVLRGDDPSLVARGEVLEGRE